MRIIDIGEVVGALIVTAGICGVIMFWWPLFSYSWHYWFGP
jgi:hypothetical protein